MTNRLDDQIKSIINHYEKFKTTFNSAVGGTINGPTNHSIGQNNQENISKVESDVIDLDGIEYEQNYQSTKKKRRNSDEIIGFRPYVKPRPVIHDQHLIIKECTQKVCDLLLYFKTLHYGDLYNQRVGKYSFIFLTPNINLLSSQESKFNEWSKEIGEGDFGAWPFSSATAMLRWWNNVMSEEFTVDAISVIEIVQRLDISALKLNGFEMNQHCKEKITKSIEADRIEEVKQHGKYHYPSNVPSLKRLCEFVVCDIISQDIVTTESKSDILAFSSMAECPTTTGAVFTSLMVDVLNLMRTKPIDFNKIFEPLSYEFKLQLVNYALHLCSELRLYTRFTEVLTYGTGLYCRVKYKLPSFFNPNYENLGSNTRLLLSCLAQAMAKDCDFFSPFISCALEMLSKIVFREEFFEIMRDNIDGHFMDVAVLNMISEQARDLACKEIAQEEERKQQQFIHTVSDFSEEFITLSDMEDSVDTDASSGEDYYCDEF